MSVSTLAAVTVIAATGALIYGRVEAAQGQKRLEAAQAEQTKASIRAERARERQAQLEASRRRREIVRNLIRNRALSTARVTAQGAGLDSSGFAGATAQGFNTAGNQTVAVNQNAELSSEVFSANEQFAQAGGRANQARSDISAGQSIAQSGDQLIRNLGTIDRVGTYLDKQFA